jgi:hypothetical protein
VASREPFLTLAGLNFVLFHATWLLPCVTGRRLTHDFFSAEMRLPWILFMIGETGGLLAHVVSASH